MSTVLLALIEQWCLLYEGTCSGSFTLYVI